MKQFLKHTALAICAALSLAVSGLSFAVELPSYLVARTAEATKDLYGASCARLNATLAQWRTGVGCGQGVKSNMMASSNHFVMKSAKQREEYEGFSPA